MSIKSRRRKDLLPGQAIFFLHRFDSFTRGDGAEDRRHVEPRADEASLAKPNGGVHRDAGEDFHADK